MPTRWCRARQTWCGNRCCATGGGADVASVLDAYFADPDAAPDTLVTAFRDVFVPIHRNDHIAAAARRADKDRVKQTGIWLVRHSPDFRCHTRARRPCHYFLVCGLPCCEIFELEGRRHLFEVRHSRWPYLSFRA